MKKKDLDKTLPVELQDFSMANAGVEPASNSSNSSNESEESSSVSQAGADVVDNSSSEEQEPHKKGEKSMADNEKVDIRKEVEALLAEKDAQASVEKKIKSLEAEKADLAQQLADATAAKDTLSSELETAKAEIQTKTQECEALAQEKDESITKAAEAQKQLEEIRAEQTVASRTAKLEEANLLLAEGEKRDAQLDKVKVMSEEAFASYVEELCDIRGISVATETNDDEGKTQTPADETKTEAGKTEEDEEGKASASIPPADLGDGQKFQQSVAAASAQVTLEDDKVEAYAGM